MIIVSQRNRLLALASFAVAVFFWVWLLAVQPIPTAAMRGAYPLIDWLKGCWSALEDMGHGPFLPLVSLYVIYLRRSAIRSSLGTPDARGVFWVLFGAAIFWVGLKLEEVRICLAALVLWTWAVPYAIFGKRVASQLVFPMGYLLLSIPRWDLVSNFTMHLRVLASAVAVGIANGIGIAAERVGTGIHSSAGAGFNLDVAEACSGLRSIFAMTALAAAYAFFTQKTLLRQWALFLCAVPVAIAGNVARIVTITIIAAWLGEETATGFYHDYSGYIVFLVGILLLMELGRLIGRWQIPPRLSGLFSLRVAETPAAAPAESPPPAAWRTRILFAAAPGLLLACIWMVRAEPPVRLAPVDYLATRLPAEIRGLAGSPLWFCHNEQCLASFAESDLKELKAEPLPDAGAGAGGEPWTPLRDLKPGYRCPSCGEGELYLASLGEQRLLSGDACLLRSHYRGSGPTIYTVTMIISGASRNSIHNPQLCLPSQGYTMDHIVTETIPAGAGTISVKRVDVSTGGTPARPASRLSFVYWFFTRDRQTSSVLARMLWTAWDRAFRRQAERWVMVTVYSNGEKRPGDTVDHELLAFSGALMNELKKERK